MMVPLADVIQPTTGLPSAASARAGAPITLPPTATSVPTGCHVLPSRRRTATLLPTVAATSCVPPASTMREPVPGDGRSVQLPVHRAARALPFSIQATTMPSPSIATEGVVVSAAPSGPPRACQVP
ncbi:MAG: hypothetical protein WKG01_31490 [Kofleriaceae bacterium]